MYEATGEGSSGRFPNPCKQPPPPEHDPSPRMRGHPPATKWHVGRLSPGISAILTQKKSRFLRSPLERGNPNNWRSICYATVPRVVRRLSQRNFDVGRSPTQSMDVPLRLFPRLHAPIPPNVLNATAAGRVLLSLTCFLNNLPNCLCVPFPSTTATNCP